MPGGASSGGGSTSSVAGSPTSRRKPSKWKGCEADQGLRPVLLRRWKVCGTPLGAEGERASRESKRRRYADVDRELPFEHVEPLISSGGRARATPLRHAR